MDAATLLKSGEEIEEMLTKKMIYSGEADGDESVEDDPYAPFEYDEEWRKLMEAEEPDEEIEDPEDDYDEPDGWTDWDKFDEEDE